MSPGLLATWNLSTSISVLPFGLDVMLRMRDGSISAFQGVLLSEESLHASLKSEGSLDRDTLKVEVGDVGASKTRAFQIKGCESHTTAWGAGR